jgi:enhancing lycopene biosynthesis protein 2
LLARALGLSNITLTVGNDKETIVEILKTGVHHENCIAENCVVDFKNKIITTPAYMFDEATPYEVFQGISKLALHLVGLA